MGNKLTVSLAQTSVSRGPDENLQTARRFMLQAAGQGTDLLVFPEMFMAQPQNGQSLATVAEPLDGPFVSVQIEQARIEVVRLITHARRGFFNG